MYPLASLHPPSLPINLYVCSYDPTPQALPSFNVNDLKAMDANRRRQFLME